MKGHKKMPRFVLMVLFLFFTGCTGMPDSIVPVEKFEVNRYLGKWYEIARLDHSFERGLTQVTAQYSLRRDGGVAVINRGFDLENNEWQQANGKAYFVEGTDKGYLKVSFFGPFYGSYVIFELDDDYSYSFVSGPDHNYLWLLSRKPEVSKQVKQAFINKAKTAGFNTNALIWVEQTPRPDSD